MSEKEMDSLRVSMSEFSCVEPIVVNKDLSVIGGHQRLIVAKELGWKQVPIMVLDLPIAKAKALNIALNKIHGEWDYPKLKDLLEEIDTGEFDMSITGFDEKEIEDLMSQFYVPEEGLTDEDEIPEEIEPITKMGDLWILDNHRLLCGDATIKLDVVHLMNTQTADLCLTDPPYSVDYKSRKEKPDKILKSYVDPKNAEALLKGFISLMPSKFLVMTYASGKIHEYVRVIDKLNFETINILIWVKQNFTMWPGARYQYQHEFIYLARQKGAKIISNTQANDSTCLFVDRETKNDLHPTLRPMELWDFLLTRHSNKDSIIYDPFLCAGTTIISAEKNGRIGYGLEISPHFCDVSVKRWENYTGKKAKLAS